MNWMQLESYLERDDRAVVPLGSTEQHAYLSLGVDSILSEGIAVEAAEPLGIPVFPVVNYGLTPYFRAYPGTVSLRLDTYLGLVRDVLDSLAGAGFKRILLVNGHGGNSAAHAYAIEWMADHPGVRVKFNNWWMAPKVAAKTREIDPVGSHASWAENFPSTRLGGVELPPGKKAPIELHLMRLLGPAEVRAYLGDGNMGGEYQKPDEVMAELWRVGVEETRELLEGPWGV